MRFELRGLRIWRKINFLKYRKTLTRFQLKLAPNNSTLMSPKQLLETTRRIFYPALLAFAIILHMKDETVKLLEKYEKTY